MAIAMATSRRCASLARIHSPAMSLPILGATDYSPVSSRMADAAAAVAVKLGAKLMLVHVTEDAHSERAGDRQVAARLRSDVICIGTRSRSALAKSLLPSTTRELLEGSDIPVFLVRTPL